LTTAVASPAKATASASIRVNPGVRRMDGALLSRWLTIGLYLATGYALESFDAHAAA
jgi:hypothetical protein